MAESSATRVEFSSATRDLTARRAGYRCSLPNCGRITVGPSADKEQTVCIGIASHIFSASPGGPRGSGGLTDDELKSPANAIWLCSDHAALIDKNRGLDYPPGRLLSYKALHEAHVARELQGVYTRFGWLERLDIHSSPLFKEPTDIELGKLTLLIGGNAVGKTAVCEWLAAAANARYLRRWQRSKVDRNRLDAQVHYLDPEPHTVRVSFLSEDYPRYYLDKKFSALPIAPLKVIFPGELRFSREQEDDLELVAAVLGLDKYEVLALCEDIPYKGTENVTRAWFQQEDGPLRLYADVKSTHPGLPFRTLSGSECITVLLEFAILAANQFAETHPTILVLDAAWHFDTYRLKSYGELLSAPTMGFQTIASIPTRDINLDELRWAGWKVFRLDGEPPNVIVTSDIRE